MLNGQFVGMGHFFYVTQSLRRCTNYGFNQTDLVEVSNQCFDYGLDVGSFYPSIPEFGFQDHFTEYVQIPTLVSFVDLFLAQDHFTDLVWMAAITMGDGLIFAKSCDDTDVPVSWIQVLAASSGQSKTTYTQDGSFTLFLRADYNYTLTFSLILTTWAYPQQPVLGIPLKNLSWGSSQPPPQTPSPLQPNSSVCPGGSPSPMASMNLNTPGHFQGISSTNPEYMDRSLRGYQPGRGNPYLPA